MNYPELAFELAAHIRKAVRPLMGLKASKRIVRNANSGDATFGIDSAAEEACLQYIGRRRLNVSYYTEDTGLSKHGIPQATLIIDPIDGTRGAKSGFECSVVSVAVTDYTQDPRVKDVKAACVYEIKEDRAFIAERGGGVRILRRGREMEPHESDVQSNELAAWSAEVAGRPSEMIGRILGNAIDASSIRGGFFVFNSIAYSLTRLVTGQLSAVVDVGRRLLKDVPSSRQAFLRAGHGTVIGLFPYDFVAAILIAREAGCIVTDAYGKPLDEVKVLESSESNVQSIIAASNPTLHTSFLTEINRGFEALGETP